MLNYIILILTILLLCAIRTLCNHSGIAFEREIQAVTYVRDKRDFKYEQKYVAFKGYENLDYTGNCRRLWLCPPSIFTENSKILIIKHYNQLRNKAAAGNFHLTNGKKTKEAKNVNRLYWFWKLEEAAQQEANKCLEPYETAQTNLAIKNGDIEDLKDYKDKIAEDDYYPQRLKEVYSCSVVGRKLTQKRDSQPEFIKKLPKLLADNFFADFDANGNINRADMSYIGCGYLLRWLIESSTIVSYITCYYCKHEKAPQLGASCPLYALDKDPNYPNLCAEKGRYDDLIDDTIMGKKACPKEYSVGIPASFDASVVEVDDSNGTVPYGEQKRPCKMIRNLFLILLLQLLTLLMFFVNKFLIHEYPLRTSPTDDMPSGPATTPAPVEMDLGIQYKRRVKKKQSKYFYF